MIFISWREKIGERKGKHGTNNASYYYYYTVVSTFLFGSCICCHAKKFPPPCKSRIIIVAICMYSIYILILSFKTVNVLIGGSRSSLVRVLHCKVYLMFVTKCEENRVMINFASWLYQCAKIIAYTRRKPVLCDWNVNLVLFETYIDLFVFSALADCLITDIRINCADTSVRCSFKSKDKLKAEVEIKFLLQSPLKSNFKQRSCLLISRKLFSCSDRTSVETNRC